MKFLKYAFLTIALLALLGWAYLKLVVSEARPNIIPSEDPKLMAQQMLSALNKPGWDTLPYIQWTFREDNHYIWDRKNNKAKITLGDLEVHLDPDLVSGNARKGGQSLDGKALDKAIQKAWSNWCNDMFWLSAPYKIKDPGTSLAVAQDADGNVGLLVSYESGGVTPGDAYLWFLDDQGLPTGYKMWVGIIPVGGVYASWSDWKELPGGGKVAQSHQGKIKALHIPITNIKAGFSWSDLGYNESPIEL